MEIHQSSDGGSVGGAVDSVSNSDSSLTISPTTGDVVASLNVTNHSNTWGVSQYFAGGNIALSDDGSASFGGSSTTISPISGGTVTSGNFIGNGSGLTNVITSSDSSLTISGNSAVINLTHTNNWTASQKFFDPASASFAGQIFFEDGSGRGAVGNGLYIDSTEGDNFDTYVKAVNLNVVGTDDVIRVILGGDTGDIFTSSGLLYTSTNNNFTFYNDVGSTLLATLGDAGLNVVTDVTVGGKIIIPVTSSTVGSIFQNGQRFIHSYGSANFFFGPSAGNFTLTGNDLVGIGNQSLLNVTSGTSDLGIGAQTLKSLTSAINDVAIGPDSMFQVTTGSHNVGVGRLTLGENLTGQLSTAIGHVSLRNALSDGNVGVGAYSLYGLSGGYYNTAVGTYSGSDGAGDAARDLIGNSIFGFNSAARLQTGSNYGSYFGYSVGYTVTTGTNLTLIGDNTDVATGTFSYATALGSHAIVGASNTMVLGGTGTYAQIVKTSTGQSTARASVGGAIFDYFTDVGNVGTGEDDLYSSTVAAASLATNGDKVTATYQGVFVGAAASTQELRLYFGGTKIYDSGALAIGVATNNWTVTVTCIRVSSSVVRCSVALSTDFGTLFPYSTYTEVTGLTLTNTQILKVTGEAAGVGAANNQIVVKMGTVSYLPAA